MQKRQSSPKTEISVVVPSYNHAPFVEKCLRSIIKQTHQPLELIVIDDGSSDGSPRIIERVLKDCAVSCELIVRPNKGLCATLNEGLARSTGAYFAYLGSDDIWFPNFLDARLKLLSSRPAAVLGYGHAYSIDEADNILDCTCEWAAYVDGNAQDALLARGLAPLSPTVVYRRAPLERHGWNEQSKLEDYELYLLLSADGDFAFDPQAQSAWRRHAYNTSRDLEFMAAQWLETQHRVGAQLGIGAERLAELQTSLKWKCAEDFARNNQRRRALKLMLHNLSGAPSATAVARLLINLSTPRAVMHWRRRIRQQQASGRYGNIQL